MFSRRHLTLLTDFGLRDGYVGILKGVIAKVDPTVSAIDISHDITPQDVAAARFCLANAYPYFPKDTVHVAVVDPGVGTPRRGIAVQLEDGYLVGPDNGIFDGVLSQHRVVSVVELTEPKYWRTDRPSRTFHARDIFAPVGAHIATGVRVDRLGKAVDPESLVRLSVGEARHTGGEIEACVQYCDRFGNLITTVPGEWVEGKTWHAVVGTQQVPYGETYSDAKAEGTVALVGSHGWVEIGADRASAGDRLKVGFGDAVRIVYR
ncbi:SAM hydrolase/SAM-dependent halogenase family protein [Baaleninema simplex]|uniref:SAM hydrolase/SAM-dependent halogenase family protein n=1 Tax=Baaleninema simplex TaxID=2862350 RepID=UPI00034CF626|nr:SAM-dependent chlorinase/fluorinase [Baaleninema simplex]